LIFVTVLALTLSCTVTAHPGHGVPEEVPSDPETDSTTSNGSTDTGSPNTGSTSTGSTSTGSTSSGSNSDGTQSVQTETPSSQTAAGSDSRDQPVASAPEEATETNSETYNTSFAGYAALAGLIVVISLVFFAFPFKNGHFTRFQKNLFVR